jgi:peptidoglycan/xylan/chitin deacetylase (PgdA/CDA1 family)
MADSAFGGPHEGTVCLTFDFDAMAGWMGSFGFSTPGAVSQGEFGGRVGIYRVLDVLERYGVPASFYIPGHTVDTFPDAVRSIAAAGHEIGHHGYLHESPTLYLDDRDGERAMYEKGIEAIERVTGSRPLGYRSPGWDLTVNSIGLLAELGFRYDSSLQGDDYHCYYARTSDVLHRDRAYEFGPESELVEIPVSWSWDDWPQFAFVTHPTFISNQLASPSKVFEIWSQDIDYMVDRVRGGVFDITFHPQMIGRGHRILLLERLIEHCQRYPSLTFARMRDVAEAFRRPTAPSTAES